MTVMNILDGISYHNCDIGFMHNFLRVKLCRFSYFGNTFIYKIIIRNYSKVLRRYFLCKKLNSSGYIEIGYKKV